jgi:hypothetical protein
MGYLNTSRFPGSPQWILFGYWVWQPVGGQFGICAVIGETVNDMARSATASSKSVLFTVNSLLKWGFHRDNVADEGATRGNRDFVEVSENVTL